MNTTTMAGRRRTVTRVEVVEAARDILDEDGFEGLTMASASARVGLTTMGVYRHVKNRDDLVTQAVALVLADVSATTVTEEIAWLEGVTAWMESLRACLLAHPWAATRLGTRQGGSSDAWLAAMQPLGAHLAASGLTPKAQARALTWTVRLTVGFIILEIGGPIRRAPRRRGHGAVGAALAEMTDDDFWADLVAQTRTFLTSIAST